MAASSILMIRLPIGDPSSMRMMTREISHPKIAFEGKQVRRRTKAFRLGEFVNQGVMQVIEAIAPYAQSIVRQGRLTC
jgi:hypothetical protein